MRIRWVGAVAALLLSLVFAASASAQQGTLTGVVVDETGAAVNAVDIEIRGSGGQFRAGTDAQGRFTLSLPPGTYDLTISRIGHQTTAESNVSVSAGQTTTVRITLPTQATALTGVAVTVDRTQQAERIIDQPATTDVISSVEISERATFNSADYLREAPGVDVITTGLQNSNIVVRGFNNIFSGSLHMLQDYRLAGVPSLRVNLMHFIPTIDEDLDRMEVVLGPGSALYGPNTANGIVHLITKSPLDQQGTQVILGGGTKSFDSPSAFQGAFRSAFLLGENVGVKVSGQYLSGEEWVYVDPVEQTARDSVETSPAYRARCIADRTARDLPASEATEACDRIGHRNYDIERWSMEARLDWRYAEDGVFVATYGRNTSSGIELTGLGAGQTSEWVYDFFQSRISKGRLFAQGYYNRSNSGNSFLLRDGVTLVDQSTLAVGQLQHGFSLADGVQDFTYGVDYFQTTPASDGRIYGTWENEDQMDEWGAYIQSKTAIGPKLDLIVAGRMDSHSVLPDNVFSPRAALVFKPDENTGIRLTYNQAFSTPTALNFFLDIAGGFAPGTAGSLGYTTRAYGSGPDGWSLRGSDGTFSWMRSPFTPDGFGGSSQIVPADIGTMWNYYVGVLEGAGGIDPATAAFLRSIPPTDTDVTRLALDVNDGSLSPLATLNLPDLPPTQESYTQTFELGYTGVINNRISIAADVYRTTKNDFVSPLVAETPLVLLNPTDIETYLTPIVGPANAQAIAYAFGFDPDTGRPNGLPLGVVSSSEIPAKGADIVVSYRNVGDITLYGGDISFQAFLTDNWTLGGMYSYVSDDIFKITGSAPLALNAPQHKGALSLSYRDVASGFNASARVRANSEFEAFSADYFGTVEATALVDLTVGYQIPSTRATLQLSMSNVFDKMYQSFPGSPEIGRFTMLRMKYDLF